MLSSVCAFGNDDAKAVLNDLEPLSRKKEVKRAVEDLVGEDTYPKYIESLRVPDWVQLYFKTKGSTQGCKWQDGLNIT